MKNTLALFLVLALSLLISTNVFANHDATGATAESHTSTSVTGSSSSGAEGGTPNSTTYPVISVPVKVEVEVETEHGVQTTTVKPDSSALCGGKEMPKLECPSGYAVGCNATVGQWACIKSAGQSAGAAAGAGASASSQSATDRDSDDDGTDSILDDSSVKSAIYIKIEDVKGESEDDKKVGDKPSQSDFSVMIDSVLVRGWDPKTKQEVAGQAPKSPETVSTEEELALFVAAQTEGDSNIESVSLNFTKIEFKYRSDAKLFGLIPSSLTQDISLEGGAVNVKKPWYSFLFTDTLSLADIQAAAEEKKKEKPMQIESWSFGANNSGSNTTMGGGAGKVRVATGDVNGDGKIRTVADVAAEFSALSSVMKASYDLKAAKK
jgi:type VI protein secretion system component Hcp